MKILPPGTILQLMYLKERLSKVKPAKFIEIGPGTGELSNLLLQLGWTGMAVDIDEETIERLKKRFANEILDCRFSANQVDFLNLAKKTTDEFDLIISSMVLEHLDEKSEAKFMECAKNLLKVNGILIGFVPSSPAHWSIEDEIAGHFRRYTRSKLKDLTSACNVDLIHTAGLTYPLSNFLLPISNFLVNRSESSKKSLSNLEKTKQSGRRSVFFKTHFPNIMVLFLNKYFLYPFFIIQKIFKHSKNALVLYFEVKHRE